MGRFTANLRKADGCDKSVAVVTLLGRFNYGNRLQNYAVYYLYEKVGLKPENVALMRFDPLLVVKDSVKRLLGRETSSPEDRMSKNRLAAFDRFNSRMRMRKIRCVPKGFSEQYSWFSVGSDQVWNPLFIKGYEDWYFLKSVRPEQRIALAPSIGLSSLEDSQKAVLRTGVDGFPRLSTREAQGAALITDVAHRRAEVICDPTIVLSPEEWRDVADRRLTPSRPYVLVYLLGKRGIEAEDVINVISEGKTLAVVYLSDREKPEEPPAGPAEFIDLVDNAAHVVTDSFHAAVFSCILQTPLTIVQREGGASMFSRLEQLSKMLGIEHKIYGSAAFDYSRAGDYAGVPEAIERERQRFMTYLKGCLDV